MPNNFRTIIASAAYVSNSPAGNDGTGTPTDPNTPRATPNNAFANTVIGSNVYKGAFTLASNSINTSYFGDGIAVIDATANVVMTSTSGAVSSNYTDLAFRLNAFALSLGTLGTKTFTRCNISAGTVTSTAGASGTATFSSCVLRDMTALTLSQATAQTFAYCKLFNTVATFGTTTTATFENNYVDESTIITWNSFASHFTRFKNNNFRGIIVVSGTSYELKKDKDGNAIDPNPAVSDLDILFGGTGTCYSTYKNFAQDPEFLYVEKKDFVSVAGTSPNLFADTTALSSIGAVSAAEILKATDSGWTLTNLVLSSGDFVLDVGQTVGTAISPVFDAFPTAQVISSLPIAALANFNTTIAKGNAENNNVTAVDNFSSGTAGANPYFLTIEARWTDSNTEPTVDADFTNNGIGTAGDYIKFLQHGQPRVDVNNLGNGDPSFVSSGSAPIKYRYVQFRITVRNGLGPL